MKCCPHYYGTHDLRCTLGDGHSGPHVFPDHPAPNVEKPRPQLEPDDEVLEKGFHQYWGQGHSLAAKNAHRETWVAARQAQHWADFDHWFGSYCRKIYSHRETRHAAYLVCWNASIENYDLTERTDSARGSVLRDDLIVPMNWKIGP